MEQDIPPMDDVNAGDYPRPPVPVPPPHPIGQYMPPAPAWGPVPVPTPLTEQSVDELLLAYANTTHSLAQAKQELDWISGRVKEHTAWAAELHFELIRRLELEAHNRKLYNPKKEAAER